MEYDFARGEKTFGNQFPPTKIERVVGKIREGIDKAKDKITKRRQVVKK